MNLSTTSATSGSRCHIDTGATVSPPAQQQRHRRHYHNDEDEWQSRSSNLWMLFFNQTLDAWDTSNNAGTDGLYDMVDEESESFEHDLIDLDPCGVLHKMHVA